MFWLCFGAVLGKGIGVMNCFEGLHAPSLWSPGERRSRSCREDPVHKKVKNLHCPSSKARAYTEDVRSSFPESHSQLGWRTMNYEGPSLFLSLDSTKVGKLLHTLLSFQE